MNVVGELKALGNRDQGNSQTDVNDLVIHGSNFNKIILKLSFALFKNHTLITKLIQKLQNNIFCLLLLPMLILLFTFICSISDRRHHANRFISF